MSEIGRADNVCRRTTLAWRMATPRELRRRLHLIGRVVRGGSTTAAAESLRDLVEGVLGESDQPPRANAELILLIAGMRQHLPHLERVVKGQHPALAEAVRALREAPVPDERMPLVIHTIRLAEMSQALIDRVDAPAPSTRAAASENSAAHTEVLQDVLTAPPDGDRPVIGAATSLVSIRGGALIRALRHRSAPLEASALAGSFQDCGPPAA